MAQQESLQLRELDVFKTRFYDNITHEFRTPLTVIGGMARYLEQHVSHGSKEKLHLITRNNKKMLELVNQMLDLSKISTGEIKPEYVQQDVIPDIIISEVLMPEMDGFEFCERIKTDERTNHIPVILLTAKSRTEDRILGLKHGADAFLTKPFEKEELLVRLEKLLEIRATMQQKFGAALIESQKKSEKKKHPFLVKVDNIILQRLDDKNLSVDEMAHELHLSTSQTYRKIKALTGMSTAIYIRTVRLNQARELLKDGSLFIADVAYQTGFKTPVYFSQCFKDLYGMSPSEYRANI